MRLNMHFARAGSYAAYTMLFRLDLVMQVFLGSLCRQHRHPPLTKNVKDGAPSV